MSGLTVNIETVLDVIERYYDNCHELRLTGHYQAFIEFNGDIIVGFNCLDALYSWILARQIELDEKEREQSAQNDKINHESASVDFMNQNFGG